MIQPRLISSNQRAAAVKRNARERFQIIFLCALIMNPVGAARPSAARSVSKPESGMRLPQAALHNRRPGYLGGNVAAL
jgi:hypothetical protein